ncbi:MAG: hypothetical protein JO167_11370 [Alphaproteobacteria bacterium]|nr:hypothetical protein [Alphaproteobacteria bacterium]
MGAFRFRVFLAAAAFACAGSAASAQNDNLTQIPARFSGNDVLLQVSLNGATPVWMKFDSSIPGSLLEASYAERTALHFPLVDVKLGPVTLEHVYFEPQAEDGAVAGRIGADALGDRVMVIDYKAHKVFVTEPVHPDVPAAPMTLARR